MDIQKVIELVQKDRKDYYGKKIIYSQETRDAVCAYTSQERGKGTTLQNIADNIGIKISNIYNWIEANTKKGKKVTPVINAKEITPGHQKVIKDKRHSICIGEITISSNSWDSLAKYILEHHVSSI